MAQLVDINGNPIQRDVLAEPQTSRVAMLNRIFAEHPSRGLTPAKLASILQQAELGDITAQHDLFLDMEERDAHIFSEMGKRKRSLLKVEWDIKPPRNPSAAERKQAGYAKELLQDVLNFDDIILDSLDAIGHGFACQEITWERIGNEWIPGAVTHRPQSWFQTDIETRTQIRLRDQQSLDGQPLWQFGWIAHVHKAKSGYLSRAGLHRVLSWPYLFKNYSVGDLAEFLEIYGIPMRLGKYNAGATDDEKTTLLSALASLGHNAAGIMPEGMMVEILEAAKGTEKPFESMRNWAEDSESKAIVGQVLSSSAKATGMGSGVADLHGEVLHDLIISDAMQLGGTYTRDLVYPILALNKGGIEDRRRLPRFEFQVAINEDITTYGDALPKLVGVGMKIPLTWAHGKLGIPEPEGDEAVLSTVQAAPPPSPPGQAPQAAALSSSIPPALPQDGLDELVSEALSDWQANLAPAADAIQALMDESAAKGETAEQFLARLPGLLKAGGPLAIDGKLTHAALVARTAAEAGVDADAEK